MYSSAIKSAAIALAIAAVFGSAFADGAADQAAADGAKSGATVWVARPEQMAYTEGWWKWCASYLASGVLEGKWTIDGVVDRCACSDEGKSIVESFGDEFMPNALGRYETARDKAMELLQTMEEVFPQPVEKGDDAYGTFCKVAERVVAAHVDMLRARKELAHFYLLHKAGVITNEELAVIDEGDKLNLPLGVSYAQPPALSPLNELGGNEFAFAEKFIPDSYKLYQAFAREHGQLLDLYGEICANAEKMNADYDGFFLACKLKAKKLAAEEHALAKPFKEFYVLHRIGEKDADDLAKADREMSTRLKPFAASLAGMLRALTLDPGADPFEMVDIPGKDYKVGKYEVTQNQWEAVMGENPSQFKGDDLPVENVSWNECQIFLAKLNSHYAASGVVYRLLTEGEWEFACRAGNRYGDYGLLENGKEGTLDEMGWYGHNGGGTTHPVGQKKPNAFGLYDMHGNVGEWTAGRAGSYEAFCGGCYCDSGVNCRSKDYECGLRDCRSRYIGFRLAVEIAPKNASSRIPQTMANQLLLQDELEESEALCEEILKSDPQNDNALVTMARIATRQGALDKAGEWLEKAQNAGADPARLAVEWSTVYLAGGQAEKALLELAPVVEIQQNNLKALRLMAVAQMQLDKLDDAEKTLARMESVTGATDDYLFQVTRGELAYHRGETEYPVARDAFERAYALRPAETTVLEWLLRLDYMMNDKLKGQTHARQLLRVNRDHGFANYIMGSVMMEYGRNEDAEEYLRRSVATDPTAAALNDLAELLHQIGRDDEAEGFARQAIEKNGELYAAYDTLAGILASTDRLEEAEAMYRKALELYSDDPRVGINLAKLLKKRGNLVAAREIVAGLQNDRAKFPDMVIAELDDLAQDLKLEMK